MQPSACLDKIKSTYKKSIKNKYENIHISLKEKTDVELFFFYHFFNHSQISCFRYVCISNTKFQYQFPYLRKKNYKYLCNIFNKAMVLI